MTPKRLTLVISAMACWLGAGAPEGVMAQDGRGFVGVSGTRFVASGREFAVAGVNNHYLTFGSKTEVERVLDDASAMGATVVRTFIQPVIGSRDLKASKTIWDWRGRHRSSDLGVNGTYMLYWDPDRKSIGINDGPDGLGKLDFLVQAAKKRGLRLLICFLDFWDYTGGIPQMVSWYGSTDKNTFFFTDARTRKDYRTWIEHVVTRVNPLTGTAYRDEPAIFAWELANEPDIQPPSVLTEWVSEMASYVKSIDRNHLVATGRANTEIPPAEGAIAGVDFVVWHGYPAYLGIDPGAFDEKIRDYCQFGLKIGKPVLLEEFGMARSAGDQASTYQRWLKLIAQEPGCDGWLVWRLVSRQDDGAFPRDDHDQFDIHNDGGPAWKVLQAAANDLVRLRQ